MRMFNALVIVCVVGCSTREETKASIAQQPPTNSPEVPPFRIRATPADLMTATTVTPLVFYVEAPTPDAASVQPVVDAIAAEAGLLTYPELAPVALGDVVVSLPPGNDQDAPPAVLPYTATIELKPSAPLQDRWYAMTVNALPAGVEAGPVESAVASLLATAMIARFNPGSSPIVREVRVCKSTADVSGEISFSENVEVAVTQSVVVKGIKPNVSCTIDQPSAPGVQFDSVSSVHFKCPMDVWADQKIEIEFPAGIKGVSGDDLGVLNADAMTEAALVSTGAWSHVFDLATFPSVGECRVIRLGL